MCRAVTQHTFPYMHTNNMLHLSARHTGTNNGHTSQFPNGSFMAFLKGYLQIEIMELVLGQRKQTEKRRSSSTRRASERRESSTRRINAAI